MTRPNDSTGNLTPIGYEQFVYGSHIDTYARFCCISLAC